jgi:hypothetical protein
MSHSEALRLRDVRAVFRILGDVRELRHDPSSQEQVATDGLCGLVGGSLGWGVVFDRFRPGAATTIERFVPGSSHDPRIMAYLEHWGQGGSFDDDPMTHLTRPSRRAWDSARRSGLLSLADWKTYQIYPGLVGPCRVRDTLVAWFRYPGSSTDRIRGYSIQRLHGESDFSLRNERVMQLFVAELRRLYQDGKLEQEPASNGLPARLQPVARLLMGSKSQKAIAGSLGLSYHTVRDYVKQIYDLLQVHSREEFQAKLRRGSR